MKALVLVMKAVHSAVFLGLTLALLAISWAALTGIPTRITWLALALLTAEVGAVGLAKGHCPLTTWTEKLGATSGSVANLFLPRWLADRAFVIGGALLVGSLFVLSLRLAWP